MPSETAAASTAPSSEKTIIFPRLDSLGPPDSWSAPSLALLYTIAPL
jgi:hypothetical protein